MLHDTSHIVEVKNSPAELHQCLNKFNMTFPEFKESYLSNSNSIDYLMAIPEFKTQMFYQTSCSSYFNAY